MSKISVNIGSHSKTLVHHNSTVLEVQRSVAFVLVREDDTGDDYYYWDVTSMKIQKDEESMPVLVGGKGEEDDRPSPEVARQS